MWVIGFVGCIVDIVIRDYLFLLIFWLCNIENVDIIGNGNYVKVYVNKVVNEGFRYLIKMWVMV